VTSAKNHNPTDIPDGETLESLLEKQVELARNLVKESGPGRWMLLMI
jgi:hypothetical protein